MRSPTPIAEMIEQVGLPSTAQFLGYVVHLPSSEEFLVKVKRGAEKTIRIWASTPEKAKRYPRYEAAIAESLRCKSDPEIGLLFDTGDQFVYASDGD